VVPRADRHGLPPPRTGRPGGGGRVRPGRAAGGGRRDTLVHPPRRRGAAIHEAGAPHPVRAPGSAVRAVRARGGGRGGVLLLSLPQGEGGQRGRAVVVAAVIEQHDPVALQPQRAAGVQLAGPGAPGAWPRRVLGVNLASACGSVFFCQFSSVGLEGNSASCRFEGDCLLTLVIGAFSMVVCVSTAANGDQAPRRARANQVAKYTGQSGRCDSLEFTPWA
jgi:hypothetical protein